VERSPSKCHTPKWGTLSYSSPSNAQTSWLRGPLRSSWPLQSTMPICQQFSRRKCPRNLWDLQDRKHSSSSLWQVDLRSINRDLSGANGGTHRIERDGFPFPRKENDGGAAYSVQHRWSCAAHAISYTQSLAPEKNALIRQYGFECPAPVGAQATTSLPASSVSATLIWDQHGRFLKTRSTRSRISFTSQTRLWEALEVEFMVFLCRRSEFSKKVSIQ